MIQNTRLQLNLYVKIEAKYLIHSEYDSSMVFRRVGESVMERTKMSQQIMHVLTTTH